MRKVCNVERLGGEWTGDEAVRGVDWGRGWEGSGLGMSLGGEWTGDEAAVPQPSITYLSQ